jgi:hypothetical protein
VLFIVVALLLLATPAAMGAADLTQAITDLPLTWTYPGPAASQMVVDAAHSHILAAGPNPGKVVELSLAGAILHTNNVAGATSVAVGGNSIYVGSCTSKLITVLDATTFAKTGTIAVTNTNPCHIVFAAKRVWYESAAGNAPLRSVAVASPNKVTTFSAYTAVGMAVAPPSTLFVAMKSGELEKLDVQGASPVVETQVSDPGANDLAITPDGMHVATTNGLGTTEFDSDLNTVATIPSIGGLAFSPDGTRLAVEQQSGAHGYTEVDVFPVGSSTPALGVAEYHDRQQGLIALYTIGLIGFSPDSTQLYMVGQQTQGGGADEIRLVTIPGSTSYDTEITPNAVAVTAVGSTANLGGTLDTFPDGGKAGRSAHVTLTDPLGNVSSVGPTTTDGTGAFGLTTPALDLTGIWHADLIIDGSGNYRGTDVVVPITVTGTSATVTLSRSANSVVYGDTETLTANMTPSTAGVTQLEIHQVIGSTDTIIQSGAVDGSGNLAVTFTPQRNATYYADHPSDDTYDPETSPSVAVGVVPVISGAWASGHTTSGEYAVFTYHASCASRGTKCPKFTEHMTPSRPGTTVHLILQVHTRSGWKTALILAGKLDSGSSVTFNVRYRGTGVIGEKNRIIASSKGTTAFDAAAWGYWYFKIAS